VLGGAPLGRVGTRERWRQTIDGDVLTAPLAGWVELGWGEEETWEALGVGERLAGLERAVGLPVEGEEALRLADRPSFRIGRRRGDDASDSAERLLRALASGG
jgi:hypothetical protein